MSLDCVDLCTVSVALFVVISITGYILIEAFLLLDKLLRGTNNNGRTKDKKNQLPHNKSKYGE